MASRDQRWRSAAWTLARLSLTRVPWRVWRPLIRLGAQVVARRPNRAVRQWQLNVETLTGRRPDADLTRRGLQSWARNLVSSFQLARLSGEQIESLVVIDPDHRARLTGLAADPGAIVALCHAGSWDLAGVWACHVGMPVSTVAEQLEAPEFDAYLRMREQLGFRVYGHRDPRAIGKLGRDAREGRLICLLADRDFSRRGVPVTWPSWSGSLDATMPPGPAHLALSTGHALLALTTHYEGDRMRIVVSEPITAAPGSTRAEAIASMTQQLCDFFSAQITAHPEDWHMLQPIFPGVVAA